MPASVGGITGPFTWDQYPKLLGPGILWFVEMLLIFDFGYAAWRKLTKGHSSKVTGNAVPPRYLAIGVFILALALVTYLLRMVAPMGKSTPVLQFPTPGYIPEYLGLFILGVVAHRRNWFHTIRDSMGNVGFIVAAVATVLLFPLATGGKLYFLGNGTWQSAVYAVWDSTVAVGMCLGLITFFRRFFDRQGRLARFLSQHAYTVFIIHTPLIVFLGLALRGLDIEHLLKFLLGSVIAVPLCFAVAWLVRKIPFASKIL
jgi:peptidoglycan/LPS O-acetylase OafA/YrhL